MALSVHKPAFPLAEYVEFMWRVSGAPAPSSRQRVYPSGAMALVIHLKKPAATFYIDGQQHDIAVPLLAGPYSRSFHIDPSQSTGVVGVYFRPGAARLFFPVPAHELHNVDIALSQIHAGEADRLLNDVGSASGERAQFLAVEEYLKRKLANARPIPPAVRYGVQQLSRAGGVRGVRKIQMDTGLSHTRFIQLFREHVGLTPKLFCRVRRFHMLIERIGKGMPVNWAQLAADCGYFDQAHLIRDFRAFAGITPGAYGRAISEQDRRILTAEMAS